MSTHALKQPRNTLAGIDLNPGDNGFFDIYTVQIFPAGAMYKAPIFAHCSDGPSYFRNNRKSSVSNMLRIRQVTIGK